MALETFKYQDEAGYYCASRYGCTGLHDEMGVGKTATIIRASEYIVAQRGLIIAPAMLRENWIAEYRKFSNSGYRLCKGMNVHDYIAWKKGKFDILVTSYEQATKWSKDIQECGMLLDFVAMDEAHFLKNTGTNRTKAILGPQFDGIGGLTAMAEHVWHVTGTPMANDPLDIYPFLAMCKAINGMTERQFVKTFFYSHKTAFGSRQTCKPEMLKDLQQLIFNNSIRRTAKDVGIHLPPIFLTSAVVDGDTTAIQSLLKEYPGLDSAITNALERGGLSFIDAPHIMTLRRLIGEAKAVPYAEMLLEELQSGAGKRVVFGIHKDALNMVKHYLETHGIHAVLNNGDTPEHERISNVEAFQNDDHTMVFLGNIRAAGVGLTLTAACEIDMLESDWSPAGNAQAIKRIHRIGQKLNVRARFMTLAKSFDEVVNHIVAGKTAAIAQVDKYAMLAAPLDLNPQFV